MASTHLVQRIEDDDFALDTINGRRVIVTCPSILGGKGSDWEGAMIFGREYLVDLLALGLAHRVLNFADVKMAMLKAGEHIAAQKV
ncbi:hypothetical protein [Chromobacterium sphagni]|uniref:Uncharacterized protein n=1 Tax=Chromobacterium sphagni TaxID=1903179 RepID=A0A1S1WYT8_9NEIS|nr:hypothetical protein [Chromobacterium sphagni]OHX12424.1 hypothetical protein BI347_02120 [Chromobacterium sphagni]OHX21490.1 hypothetical protein BI344_02885 [Chromobacterium sphagni]